MNQIKCQKQKLSKLQPENKPGFETRVLAVTYIGQTINRFSVRWNTHRHIWNSNTLDSEKAALSIHYHKNHTDLPYKNKPISECYTVTFLQQPSNSSLDICESRWIHLLDASINIQATLLPIQR